MAQVYFTADTHFGHRRSIALCQRPFADTEHMNETLIENWNATVRPDDVVYHLGDFSYRSGLHPKFYFNRLNGIKHLVVGNHDGEATLSLAWASISQIAELQLDGERIVLCHYPMLEWHQSMRRSMHLFGHVHGNRDGMPNSLDVGVDVWGYAPVSLPQIRESLAELAAIEKAALLAEMGITEGYDR